MAFEVMPWRRSIVIMSMKSAVVPGRRSPRRVARSRICWNSGPTAPVFVIMDARSCVSEFSAGMKAPTTERSGPAILLPPAISAALPAAIMPTCIISLPCFLRSSASLRCCSPILASSARCLAMAAVAPSMSVFSRAWAALRLPVTPISFSLRLASPAASRCCFNAAVSLATAFSSRAMAVRVASPLARMPSSSAWRCLSWLFRRWNSAD